MRNLPTLLLIKYGIQLELAYRMRSVIWTLQSLVWIIIFPVVWLAVYGPREVLIGFTKYDLLTYFVGLTLMEYLTESYAAQDMHYQIREGDFTKYLLRPMNPVSYFFWTHAGYRILRIIIFGSVFLAAYWWGVPFSFPDQWYTWPLLLVALALGNLIAFNFAITIGCLAFWLEEAEPIMIFEWIATHILKGWIGPLVFLPLIVQQISMFLPFQYIIYFPLMVYLEKIALSDVGIGFTIALGWLVALYLIRRVVWHYAIKHYNAVGQ